MLSGSLDRFQKFCSGLLAASGNNGGQDPQIIILSGRFFKDQREKEMKRVAITGGAGFLGIHLCKRLLREGNEIICIDNFLTGQEKHAEQLLASPRCTVMRHDVAVPFSLNVDEIYNLACPASPIHYQSDPIGTTKTSVLGAINVLELARKNGATVLQASTSEVYGDPQTHPQAESYWGSVNPIGIRACYDEGKRCAESLFFDYARQYHVKMKVARIFNTYGPCMHPEDGRVVSNFITQALRGHELTLYGDGSQTRSFCYCDDLIDGLVRTMASPREFTGPVNLGNPKEFTVMELAKMVLSLTDSKSRIIRRPLPVDDPTRRRPDITLAIQKLGWKPLVELEEGLRRTIDYFLSI